MPIARIITKKGDTTTTLEWESEQLSFKRSGAAKLLGCSDSMVSCLVRLDGLEQNALGGYSIYKLMEFSLKKESERKEREARNSAK